MTMIHTTTAQAGFASPLDGDPIAAGAAAIRTNAAATLALVNGMHSNMQPLGTLDLDAATLGGIWFQGNAADATAARHYPVTAGGILEVFVWNASPLRCVQRFMDYANRRIYVRANTGSWSAWTAQ